MSLVSTNWWPRVISLSSSQSRQQKKLVWYFYVFWDKSSREAVVEAASSCTCNTHSPMLHGLWTARNILFSEQRVWNKKAELVPNSAAILFRTKYKFCSEHVVPNKLRKKFRTVFFIVPNKLFETKSSEHTIRKSYLPINFFPNRLYRKKTVACKNFTSKVDKT